jgi:hypothetical protein
VCADFRNRAPHEDRAQLGRVPVALRPSLLFQA